MTRSNIKINLACGGVFVTGDGWLNLDYSASSPAVPRADLLGRLPLSNDSAALVYSSRFLEHIPRGDVPGFLAECRRVLAPGGILRLVLPDLANLCRASRVVSVAVRSASGPAPSCACYPRPSGRRTSAWPASVSVTIDCGISSNFAPNSTRQDSRRSSVAGRQSAASMASHSSRWISTPTAARARAPSRCLSRRASPVSPRIAGRPPLRRPA